MQNLHQTLQETQAGDLIHSLLEIVEYASAIITLYPGEVTEASIDLAECQPRLARSPPG